MKNAFQPPAFDRIARPYRWCEYLALGRTLERVRFHLVPQLSKCRHALVLGEGDGRFLALLLASSPGLRAEVVDGSPAMQMLARQRVDRIGSSTAARVMWRVADIRAFQPAAEYDLVVTNFVLDCFTQAELDAILQTVAPHLRPGSIWCNADFCLPQSGLARSFAKGYIRLLYTAFAVLTGLHVRSLPDDAAALNSAGLALESRTVFLLGMLKAELWRKPARMRP